MVKRPALRKVGFSFCTVRIAGELYKIVYLTRLSHSDTSSYLEPSHW